MRVALYVRVSTQRQAQQQNVEQQVERLRTHVAAHVEEGWEVREEHVFRDDGYSGATLRRPGLERLRDTVAARALDLVLVTAPDRLARNYVHQMLLLEELERGGCQVAFLDRPMSQDPHDHLLLQIRGAVAEYERTLIAERMRRGRLRKLQADVLLPWTKAPYGYRLGLEHPRDPAGVWVDPTEAAMVEEIFARYLQTAGSLGGVAKYLTAQGLPTPMGNVCWKGSSVRGILTNPAYTGQVYAGRVTTQPARARRSALQPVGSRPSATHLAPAEWLPVARIPGLVSQEQFDQVQAKLAIESQFARRHNTAHPYLLRALVSCGQCRLACLGRCPQPGYAYYLCRGKAHKILTGRAEKCHARFIPAQQLDEVVWQDLCDVLLHPSSMTQALARANSGQWAPQELQARRTNLRRAGESITHQIDRLTQAYLKDVMPLAEYQRRRTALEQQGQAVERQLNQLEADAQRQRDLAGLTQSVEALCQRLQGGLEHATFAQKRQLVELLIDRVVVTNEEVEIRYVIPTTPASEHVRFCHLRTDYFDTFVGIIATDAIWYGLCDLAGGIDSAHRGGIQGGGPAPMTDADRRVAIEYHWAASQAGDEAAEQAIYADDAVLEYPQSGERFRGGRNIQGQRGHHPARREFVVRRVRGSGDLWITELVITYDGKPFDTVSIMEFRADHVVLETQYFTEPFEAAAWRAQWADSGQRA